LCRSAAQVARFSSLSLQSLQRFVADYSPAPHRSVILNRQFGLDHPDALKRITAHRNDERLTKLLERRGGIVSCRVSSDAGSADSSMVVKSSRLRSRTSAAERQSRGIARTMSWYKVRNGPIVRRSIRLAHIVARSGVRPARLSSPVDGAQKTVTCGSNSTAPDSAASLWIVERSKPRSGSLGTSHRVNSV
jgi:hypothetical protein